MAGKLIKSVFALLFFLISKFDGTESNHARRLSRRRKHKNTLSSVKSNSQFTSESHITSTNKHQTRSTSKSHSKSTSTSHSSSKSTSKSSSNIKDWSDMSANEKKHYIFYKVLETERKSNIFPTQAEMGDIFTGDMEQTFDHDGDITRPYNGIKFPHPIGGVCMVELVAAQTPNHTYSGLFRGAPHGVARLGYAGEPRNNRTIPGISVKLLRDGQLPSANLFALESMDGHFGGNFFESELSNHIPTPHGLAQLALAQFFNRSSFPATMVGLSHVAEFGVNGEAENMDFPFELRFVPNNDLTQSFRDTQYDKPIMETLGSIEPEIKLYDIYAVRDPWCTESTLIGALKTKSRFVQSGFGDLELFFQHQKMADDIILNPDWGEFAKNGEGLCPMGF